MTVRRRRLAPLIVTVLALAVACSGGDDDSPSAAGGQELKIGLLTPQSGPNSIAGREARQGAQLAVDVINGLNPSIPLPLAAEAGLPNLGGAKVKLVVADANGADPQITAGNAINKLVSTDGVNAIVGAYDPQVTEYASQRSERYEIPFINGDSPATFLTDAGRDWFFRIGPSWRTSGESFFSLLREEEAATGKIAIFYADDKAGNDIVTTVKELATEGGGGSVVQGFPYHENGDNIGETIDKVKAFGPDALFLYVTPATVKPTLTSFAVRQYKPRAAMAFSLGYLTAGDFAQAAAAANGLQRAVSWSSETANRNPAGQAIDQLYKRRYNSPMTEAAASSFTAIMTVAQAANNAGSVQNQRIRSALLSLNVPGDQTVMPWAGIQFDETHQNVLAQSLVEQNINGAFKIVYPNDSTTDDVQAVYPAK